MQPKTVENYCIENYTVGENQGLVSTDVLRTGNLF